MNKTACLSLCLALLLSVALADATSTPGAVGEKGPAPGQLLVLGQAHVLTDSVLQALDDLGVTYTAVLDDLAFDTMDFSPYDTVLLGADGGVTTQAAWAALADVPNQGKRLAFYGGCSLQAFRDAVNDNLVQLDTACNWQIPIAPHFTVTNPGAQLADGLPSPHSFVNSSCAYYMGRPTDPGIHVAAQNGDGWPCLFSKKVGSGVFAWCTNTPNDSYYADAGDYAFLKQVVWNLIHAQFDVLLIRTNDVVGSVAAALTDLGYAFDEVYASTAGSLAALNLSGYSTVVVAMDGGFWDETDIAKLAEFTAGGGRLVGIGGSCYADFALGIDVHLFDVDAADYCWAHSSTPHLTVLYDQNRLAIGLPSVHNYAGDNDYYSLRPMGWDVQVAAENGDGWPCLIKKRLGNGWLAWYTASPYTSYWADPGDYTVLKRVIFNMMHVEERAVRVEWGWNMISYPALDPEEAVSVTDCHWQTGTAYRSWAGALGVSWFQDPGFYYVPVVGYGAIGTWMGADDTYFRYDLGYWFLCYGKPGTTRYLLFPGPR